MIIPVAYSEYADYLMGDNIFNISVLANVKESSFNYISMIDFRFRMPDIRIEIEGDTIRGQVCLIANSLVYKPRLQITFELKIHLNLLSTAVLL